MITSIGWLHGANKDINLTPCIDDNMHATFVNVTKEEYLKTKGKRGALIRLAAEKLGLKFTGNCQLRTSLAESGYYASGYLFTGKKFVIDEDAIDLDANSLRGAEIIGFYEEVYFDSSDVDMYYGHDLLQLKDGRKAFVVTADLDYF